MVRTYASVAQSVEQGTENPRVVGSIPTGGTTKFKKGVDAYESIEHQEGFARGSRSVFSLQKKAWGCKTQERAGIFFPQDKT